MASEDQNPGLGCLVTVAIFAAIIYYSFADNPHAPKEIDSTGYLSHKVESIITAQATWMVGESKYCTSFPSEAGLYNKPEGYAFSYVSCDGGPVRNIPITFWGAEYQLGKKYAKWYCTRTADSFTCKQLGAD